MGRIHPRAEQFYFQQHPGHRAIVRPFLSCFDVTHAFPKAEGDGLIFAFFLKPELFIAEMVGLERELLLVYAPFDQFQARTIEIHDAILTEDRLRLDPIGSIIVTDAPNTGEMVQDYLDSEPDRPPIVGLATGELNSLKDANDIRALFFQKLFRRDLFALESPIRRDLGFFGRNEIVTQLLDRYRQGQNSGLFGLRRIGKTSVLYALGRRCRDTGVAGTLYLDLSNPGMYQSRWWELLQVAVRAVAEPMGLERGDRSRVRALTLEYGEKDAANHFKADIGQLFRRLPAGKLLLLLDEVEHITFDISPAEHWRHDFLPLWQTIRSVHQDTQGKFGFVVAGVNPHILEVERIENFDNPLFSTTKAFYLGPFTRESVREMVRKLGRYMGITCEEPLYNRLFEEYGGHPYLVRQACSHMVKHITQRPGSITTQMFEQDRVHISVGLEKNVRQILNVLAIWYPDEYDMIRILAQGERESFVAFANESAGFTEHVEGYGLVKDARYAPKLLIGVVRDYLRKIGPGDVEPGDRHGEAITVEVSLRRNRLERTLRKVLREGIWLAFGKQAGHQTLKALSEARRQVLSQFGFGQVWAEMYLTDLMAILDYHWEIFAKGFANKKSDVLQWIDQVNRCRVDAHSRDITEEDLTFLRVCFRRLEEILVDVAP